MPTWLRRLLFVLAAVLILAGFGVWAYTYLSPAAPAWLRTAFAILGGFGVLVAVIAGVIQAWAALRGQPAMPPRPPDFPFAIVRRPEKVLTALFGESPDPLADDKLAYQEREEGRDITAELRERLRTERWVLVRSISGLGKTREIGELARQLVAEGYTLGNLGLGYADLGQVEEAIEYTRRALTIFEEIRLPYAEKARKQLAQLEEAMRKKSR